MFDLSFVVRSVFSAKGYRTYCIRALFDHVRACMVHLCKKPPFRKSSYCTVYRSRCIDDVSDWSVSGRGKRSHDLLNVDEKVQYTNSFYVRPPIVLPCALRPTRDASHVCAGAGDWRSHRVGTQKCQEAQAIRESP